MKMLGKTKIRAALELRKVWNSGYIFPVKARYIDRKDIQREQSYDRVMIPSNKQLKGNIPEGKPDYLDDHC